VFTADLKFEGFDTRDWDRFLSLFRPRLPSGAPRDPSRPQGGVIAVTERGRLLKLVHTSAGRLQPRELGEEWPLRAEALCARLGSSWAAVIEVGTLESIMERFGARARRGDDLTVQTLTLLGLARDELQAGRIDLYPRRLQGMPLPSAGMVRGTLDSLCRPGRSLLLGLFEGGEVWTSLALRRREGGIDYILGPEELRGAMGLVSNDWRRDYRHLADAVERRLGPLALGCFAEASTFRSLIVDPSPGAWSKAVAIRDVVLSPVPPALALPLGLDAARAAVWALRTWAQRVDPFGVVQPAVDRLREAAANSGLGAALGFEPLELLRRLLARDR
jgi:hypothetical protein